MSLKREKRESNSDENILINSERRKFLSREWGDSETEPMENSSFDVKKYVRSLIGPLLDYPDDCQIEVSRSHSGGVTTIELLPVKPDYGKLIGRGGKTYEALETILKAVEWNDKSRYVLRVDTPSQEFSERP